MFFEISATFDKAHIYFNQEANRQKIIITSDFFELETNTAAEQYPFFSLSGEERTKAEAQPAPPFLHLRRFGREEPRLR